jgi:hypothetical protein
MTRSVPPNPGTSRNLGFAWHIKCTSKQVYTISRLITELCPSFLPQDIEKQFFSDLPLVASTVEGIQFYLPRTP